MEAYQIWEKYQQGVDHHSKMALYTKVEKCHNFYEGEQWRDSQGVIADDLPIYNIIKPTVDYKTSMIAQNSMVVTYSPQSGDPVENELCEQLTAYAAKQWEKLKMDTKLWSAIKEAAITGDSFLFFFDDKFGSQLLTSDQVFLGDEQQQDIQKQPYIIIYERRLVSDVREEARRNGLAEEVVMQIISDSAETDLKQLTEEVKSEEGEKVNTLLYFTRENGMVKFCRSTQNVIFQEMQEIPGMNHYPIAKYTWEAKHRNSRGVGEVHPMIHNQVEINKTLYRRLEAMKMTAFPKPVYVENMVENPDSISAVGTPIRINGGNVQRLSEVFTYMQPAQMSGDAKLLMDEMLNTTRDLANAGEAALGNIDPTKASGAAIVAVKDAQAIPLNEQKAAAKQFVEDIARIWVDEITAYGVNGIEVEPGVMLDGAALAELELEIRVDVSDGNPYSKFAREQALENALANQFITFEEYVEALDEDSHAPKAKFQDILNARMAMQEEQMAMQMGGMPGGMLQM